MCKKYFTIIPKNAAKMITKGSGILYFNKISIVVVAINAVVMSIICLDAKIKTAPAIAPTAEVVIP